MRLLSFLIAGYIYVLRLTCRVVVHDTENVLERLKDPSQAYIYASWHGRLLLAAPFWLQHKRRKARLTMLSSSHKDGKMIANACKLLGFDVVFGSSTRGGAAGLRGLVAHAKKGHNIYLTPDGPKGPIYEAKPGVVDAARLTQLPILPLGLAANGKTLKSWDKFLAIRPFSTIHVVLENPIAPPSKAERENALLQLTETLDKLQKEAETYLK